jgi:hypothetical protein
MCEHLPACFFAQDGEGCRGDFFGKNDFHALAPVVTAAGI